MVNLTVEVRKTLWGNAGNRCAFTDCGQRLIGDLVNPDQASTGDHGVIGEEAHIRSSRPTGPRHDPAYPSDKLNDYENLILLCPTHHTVIDKKNGSAWPVGAVLLMKDVHEKRVDAAMDDPAKGRKELEVALAARVDRWEASVGLAEWEALTGYLTLPYPEISSSRWRALAETASWLAGLSWPSQYPKLSAAFETHRGVLSALVRHVSDSFITQGDRHIIRRRHKEQWFGGSDGERKYTEAISQFGVDDWTTVVLTTELTRSVNLVLTAVNDELLPLYRFNDGPVQMLEGDAIMGVWSSRPRYDPVVWDDFPKVYVLSDIIERVRTELDGGDPRNGLELDASAFDASMPRNGRI